MPLIPPQCYYFEKLGANNEVSWCFIFNLCLFTLMFREQFHYCFFLVEFDMVQLAGLHDVMCTSMCCLYMIRSMCHWTTFYTCTHSCFHQLAFSCI